MKNILSNHAYKVIIFLLCIGVLISCKKNETTDLSNQKEGMLTFTVQGVNSLTEDSGKKASLNSTSALNTTLASTETKLSSKVILSTSSEESTLDGSMESVIEKTTISNKAYNVNNKVAANIVMKKNTTYRIMLYFKDNGAFAKSVLAKAQTPVEIPVQENREYIWYAYSYNNEDDIPLPDVNNPSIATPMDKELLWATSGPTGVSAGSKGVALPITFNHKLAQIHIKVNPKFLYGDITDIKLKFSQNYIKTSDFSIKTGNPTGSASSLDVGNLNLTPTSDDPKVLEAKYYTIDPTVITTYKVTITDLSVKYINDKTEVLASSSNTKEATFGTYASQIGKSHIGHLNLNYYFGTPKTILHLAHGSGVSHEYSYAGERVGKASYNMFIEPKNFGPNGIVKTTQPHTHTIEYTSNKVAQYLTGTTKPDIIIVGQYYYFNNEDINALTNYVNGGGVLFLMSDNGTVANLGHRQLLKDILGSSVTLDITPNGPGAVYKIANTNTPITVGQFGDVRNGFWGEDASYTMFAGNLPTNQVEILSTARAVNVSSSKVGATMFLHKTKNFFWIGDAGFLSNKLPNGTYSGIGLLPFATNSQNYPITKPYGLAGPGVPAGGYQVANSIIYANFLAWALVRSEFYGINSGGLK